MPKKPSLKKSVKTKSVKKPLVQSKKPAAEARVRKLTRRQSRQQARREKSFKTLPNAWKTLKTSLEQLYRNKKLFLGILLTYGVFNILFVKGIGSNFQLDSLKNDLLSNPDASKSTISNGITLFGNLIGSSSTGSTEASGVYQTILLIVFSLAVIWALRQTYNASVKLTVKDSLYKGMNQLVPFLVVMFFIIIQLVPFLIASFLFSEVQNSGIATTGVQQLVWYAILIAGTGISLFFLSSSVFALYIVTLAGTQPRAALKTARKLVRFRRWVIIRKLVFLPIILFLTGALVLIPLIILIPVLAELTFMFATVLLLGVVHSYLYNLYRSML